jgi:formate hydrogenlyase subunit 6/NADH:ubiquinone oxidoreductase subunit I
LVLELSGDIDQLEASIEWMRSQEINVSLASREIVINENSCVDCGLCTGVCPTEALILDPETFKLNFRRSRCVVCEQCIPACPVQAISTNF